MWTLTSEAKLWGEMGDAVFGISLGTATASIAVSKGNKTELLANHAGERTTPTLVTYRDGKRLIGRSAKQSLHHNARNTVSHMTLLIGKQFTDEDVQKMAPSLMCKLGVDERGRGGERERVCYVLDEDGKEKKVSVSENLTHILRNLHETAGSFSSSGDKPVVLAVPASYTIEQMNLVRSCCEEAGFDLMSIISEPAAICLAHDIGQSSKNGKSYVLVYNLGANTMTVTVVMVIGGMYCDLVTKCELCVGGSYCDEVIANFLAMEFERKWKVSIHDNKKARYKLLTAAESAKHALSTVQTTSIHIESLHDGLDFTYSLSRGRFEGLCAPVFRQCIDSDMITYLLSEAGITRDDLNHVMLAGGSCKIVYLQKLLESEFPNSKLLTSPPPDEAIATGCALQASLMQRRWERGREEGECPEREGGVDIACVPHDLWIKGDGLRDQLLVPSLTPLPCHNVLSITLSPTLLMRCKESYYCLELWEKSTNQETEIAKLMVPVNEVEGTEGEEGEGVEGEGVSVKVVLVWTDSMVTMTATMKDSDWTVSIPLSCDTSDDKIL